MVGRSMWLVRCLVSLGPSDPKRVGLGQLNHRQLLSVGVRHERSEWNVRKAVVENNGNEYWSVAVIMRWFRQACMLVVNEMPFVFKLNW